MTEIGGTWKEVKGNWQETDRRMKGMKGMWTRKKMLCMSVYLFFQYSHINCEHHGDQGHAFRVFYLWGFGHGMQGQWKDMDMNR